MTSPGMHIFLKGMLLAFVCLMGALASAQNIQVKGHFEADSIGIGQEIPFTLSARYPKNYQVLFPDSTFSFKPFEIARKRTFTTITRGENSYDSAVYYLTTFEIDSVQRLSLPVFIAQERDCVSVYSRTDSIMLSFRVASVPDSVSAEKLPLKSNTAYQDVRWLFNYPFYSVLGFGLVIVLVLIWIFFGKRIRRYFALRKLQRDYREFLERFNHSLEQLSSEFNSRRAEETLVMWKDYMEGLENYPYTKSTSREILKNANDQNLGKALVSIDRGIYGGFSSTLEPFRFLQSYSQQRFQKKEEEVKHG